MANKHQYDIGVVISADGTRATSEIRKVDGAIGRMGSTAKNALSSFVGNVGANAVSYIAGAAADAGKELLRYSANIETTKVAFESLSGSAAFATQHIKDLQRFSIENSMPFDSLITMSQRLQAAGVQGERLLPILRDIGNVAAATGNLSTERLDGIATALSQIVSKTRLSAEEMEQLAERTVPGWKLLKESTGISIEQLRKLGEEGVLTAEDILQAFAKAGREKFGDAMKKQAETGAGAMIGLKNAVMVTASQALEPFYKEFSQLAVRANKEIQAQGGDLEAVGAIIGKYIGEGLGKGLLLAGKGIGNFLGESISFGVGLSDKPDVFSKFLMEMEDGFDNAFWVPLEDWWNGKSSNVQKTQTAVMQRWVDTGKTVKNLPDASKILNAEKAKKEAEALKKEYETLTSTLSDLMLQVSFFGDESEVAATKQKLMSAGITDFNKGLAKGSLLWAERLDQLKEAKKLQDEYNDRLKSEGDELRELRQDADFKLRFAEPTELDNFNEQLRRGKFNLRELKSEVELTEKALKNLIFNRDASARDKNVFNMRDSFKEMIGDISGDKKVYFQDYLAELFKDSGLENAVDSRGNKAATTPQRFADRVTDQINEWRAALDQAGNDMERQAEVNEMFGEMIDRYFASFYRIGGEGDMPKKIFAGDDGTQDWKKWTLDLLNTFENNKLQTGIIKLDEIFESLGLSALKSVSKTDEFNKLLGDSSVTKAIESRAAALGMTSDELERLIKQTRSFNEIPLLNPEDLGVNPRRRPNPEPEGIDRGNAGNFFGNEDTGFFGGIGVRKFQSDAEMMKSTMQELGAIGADSFNQLAGAIGSTVEQWVLYGDMSGQSARKAIASALAAASAQATVSAIMETAYGIAALTPWGAMLYGPAPFHFKSAALFAAVAAGTGLIGRGVAGDSFANERGGGSNAGSPDYQTVQSAQVQQSTTTYYSNQPGYASQSDVQTLASAIDGLNNKITGMKPNDVVAVGLKTNPQLASNAVNSALKSDSTARNNFGKTLGLG